MLRLAIASLVVAASSSRFIGGYYPTDPDAMDRYCQVIGEAPDVSVPPRDRLWFQENCHCTHDAGCGKLASYRFWKRREAAYDAWKKEQSREKAPPPRRPSPPPRPQ